MNERFIFEDGKFVHQRYADVDDVLTEVRETQGCGTFGKAAIRKLGSIPGILAAQWQMECGARIGTSEWAEYAAKQLMKPEWKHLRVNNL